MDLGQKIRQSRLEAGLSQRQLGGDEITRNMLSQIENGSARPSMDTLMYLARQLGKPIGYFLEEQSITSPNQTVMDQARLAFHAAQHEKVLEHLVNYHPSDPVYDRERWLLEALSTMTLAEQAIAEHRLPYAVHLLEQAAHAGARTPYYIHPLEQQRLLLLAQATGTPVPLPADDRPLLLRAKKSLEQKNLHRAAQYLDATEDHFSPEWNLLYGQLHIAQENYAEALSCLKAAESSYPKETVPLLERCCRELEDYKGAYLYACKLRELSR